MRPHKRFLMFAALAAIVCRRPCCRRERRRRATAHGGARRRRGRRRLLLAVLLVRISSIPGTALSIPTRPYGYGVPPRRARRLGALEVKPKEAEVYVDGYYAGIVDDFDGTFQRLRVEPGEHEIELWLDGYRTVQAEGLSDAGQHVQDQVSDGAARRRRAAGAEAAAARTRRPATSRGGSSRRMQPPMPPAARIGRRRPAAAAASSCRRSSGQPEARRGRAIASYGTLAIRVQPADAEVSIDGEAWRGPGGQDRLVVEVAEGSHTVEIRKAGYRTYVTQVDVRRGQTTPLNVSLRGEQYDAHLRRALVALPAPDRGVRPDERCAAGAGSRRRAAVAGPDDVERIHNGFLAAPDFKVTELRPSDRPGSWAATPASSSPTRSSSAAAATGWSPTRTAAMLGYGGLIMQWFGRTNETLGFSAKMLIGGGDVPRRPKRLRWWTDRGRADRLRRIHVCTRTSSSSSPR